MSGQMPVARGSHYDPHEIPENLLWSNRNEDIRHHQIVAPPHQRNAMRVNEGTEHLRSAPRQRGHGCVPIPASASSPMISPEHEIFSIGREMDEPEGDSPEDTGGPPEGLIGNDDNGTAEDFLTHSPKAFGFKKGGCDGLLSIRLFIQFCSHDKIVQGQAAGGVRVKRDFNKPPLSHAEIRYVPLPGGISCDLIDKSNAGSCIREGEGADEVSALE